MLCCWPGRRWWEVEEGTGRSLELERPVLQGASQEACDPADTTVHPSGTRVDVLPSEIKRINLRSVSSPQETKHIFYP